MADTDHPTPGPLHEPYPIRRRPGAPDPEEHMTEILSATEELIKEGVPQSEAILRARVAERKRLKELGLLVEKVDKVPREVRVAYRDATIAREAQARAEAELKAERRSHGETQDKLYRTRCELAEAREGNLIDRSSYRSMRYRNTRLDEQLTQACAKIDELHARIKELAHGDVIAIEGPTGTILDGVIAPATLDIPVFLDGRVGVPAPDGIHDGGVTDDD